MKRSKYEKGYAVPVQRRGLVLPRAILAALILVAVTSVGGAIAWRSLAADTSGEAATRSYALPEKPVSQLAVEIAQPVVDLGRVALNTPAQATWTLRNTGTSTVRLGKPGVEVLEGC